MPSLLLRGGLWLSLAVVVVAVYLGLQGPLQQVFTSGGAQTFCYSKGVTTKFSTEDTHACFTVEDGHFSQAFSPVPESVEVLPGHAIPGLWDGVRGSPQRLDDSATNSKGEAWPLGSVWGVPPLCGPLWIQISQGRQRSRGCLYFRTRRRGLQGGLDQGRGLGPDVDGRDANCGR
jgi:hypothetical protein